MLDCTTGSFAETPGEKEPRRTTARLLVTLLAAGFFSSIAHAAPILLSAANDAFAVNKVDLLVDVDGQRTLDDVRQDSAAFRPLSGGVYSLGFVNAPVWVRLSLQNDSDIESWVFDMSNPRLGRVDLFLLNAHGEVVTARASGVQLGAEGRQFPYSAPAWKLPLPPGQPYTLYLRVHHQGALVFDTTFYTPSAFNAHLHAVHFNNYMFEGALLAMVGLMLLIYLGLRERSYLWHATLAATFLLFAASASGTANLLLWPNATWWADHAPSILGMLMGASAIPSALTFFGKRRIPPALYAAAKWVAVLALFNAVLCFTDWTAKYYIRALISFLVPLIVTLLALSGLKTGNRSARFYFVGWAVAVIAAALGIVRDMGVPIVPGFSHLELTWIFFIGIMAWGLALTGRIQEEQRRNRATLEVEVERRTHQLRDALAEVKTLSGLLPICSHCKKIRDDDGFWREVEAYVSQHTDADFSHGLCPACLHELYPEYYGKKDSEPDAPDSPSTSEG